MKDAILIFFNTLIYYLAFHIKWGGELGFSLVVASLWGMLLFLLFGGSEGGGSGGGLGFGFGEKSTV